MATLTVKKWNSWTNRPLSRIAIFAPHLDDEVLGAFSILSGCPASFQLGAVDGTRTDGAARDRSGRDDRVAFPPGTTAQAGD